MEGKELTDLIAQLLCLAPCGYLSIPVDLFGGISMCARSFTTRPEATSALLAHCAASYESVNE